MNVLIVYFFANAFNNCVKVNSYITNTPNIYNAKSFKMAVQMLWMLHKSKCVTA